MNNKTSNDDLIDVSVVLYKPDRSGFISLLDALSSQENFPASRICVYLFDNSCDAELAQNIREWIAPYTNIFYTLSLNFSSDNLGYGKGNNKAVSLGENPWVLVINQDIEMEPDCLAALYTFALDDERGALWEARQIPYEHPKIYNPVTLSSFWASGAIFLVKRALYEAVGGFDPKLFMYGEDVDLSWRIRALGYEVRYVPWAAALHETYTSSHEVKPLQALEGTYSNLCLRARYGNWKQISLGLLQWASELLVPQSFPGRRFGLLKVGLRYARDFASFRSQGRPFRKNGNVASFSFWNYCIHRDGAFFSFKQTKNWAESPLVSILIRTCGKPELLREALLTATRQTYSNVQVVVVEDGPGYSRTVVESAEFLGCNIKYEALGDERQGRSIAGNRALALADGEWLCFLDDDDQLFLDHCEVLIQTALENGVKGAYAWSWEVQTEFQSQNPLRYEEKAFLAIHKQPFNRLKLWHENYLPIQTVLFHRSLYEKWGGFETDMDQLEDWNLWVRYSLEDDFKMVEKTTSKYRVPAQSIESGTRQKLLDEAYSQAMQKHDALEFSSSPAKMVAMLKAYQESQVVIPIYKSSIRANVHQYALGRLLVRLFRAVRGRLAKVR